jgi:tRNA-dihydrouridine synthase
MVEQQWGAPILAMAPMVGQSDYPFRTLCRRHGTTVCWSEMLMAGRFASDARCGSMSSLLLLDLLARRSSHGGVCVCVCVCVRAASYRARAFGSGVREDDHPLVVQFAANTPRDFVAAALAAQALGADGVDLNLGCPQRRACVFACGHSNAWHTQCCLYSESRWRGCLTATPARSLFSCRRQGHYGAHMTNPNDWALCVSIVRAGVAALRIPVTVKIRLQVTTPLARPPSLPGSR